MMTINDEHLKKFILESGLVSKSDLEEVFKIEEEKKQKVSNVLLSEGKITETDLKRMEAFVLGIPFIDLSQTKIDFSILSLIPEPIARNSNIVAYKKDKDSLEVAMLDVDDLPVIDFIKKRSGFKILPRLTDGNSIKAVLIQYRQSLKTEFQDIIQKEANALKDYGKEDEETRPND